MNIKLSTLFLGIIALIGVGFILYIGKSIFISLILAFFIYILLTSAYNFFYEKIGNTYISISACFFFLVTLIGILSIIISTQVTSFGEDISKYEEVFSDFTRFVENKTGFSFDMSVLTSSFDISGLFASFSNIATTFLGQVGTILFLLIFMFLEKKYFITKIENVFPQKERKKIFNIFSKIHSDLSLYFGVKFFIALANGFVSFIIMLLFGLEYALFFALLVFLLDFIPNIGGIIALSLPFLFSFTLFDSTLLSFLLLGTLLIPQTITGNFIEPKFMGRSLNISGFVILLSLLFWGSLWGITGAFLAVPLMTAIKIILGRFEKTKALAIFLSEKGKI